MCGSYLCSKKKSVWEGFVRYDSTTFPKSTQKKKATSDIRVHSESMIPM
jgi:hypothetical protein